LLGVFVPEEYGGPDADPLAILIVAEELGRSPAGATVGSCLNSDMATRFLVDHGTDAQKRRWLPGIVTGDIVQAMALTESESGSDAASIRSTAVRDGDDYVINGSNRTYPTAAAPTCSTSSRKPIRQRAVAARACSWCRPTAKAWPGDASTR
jgi:acyl-CoA dehydrogenase